QKGVVTIYQLQEIIGPPADALNPLPAFFPHRIISRAMNQYIFNFNVHRVVIARRIGKPYLKLRVSVDPVFVQIRASSQNKSGQQGHSRLSNQILHIAFLVFSFVLTCSGEYQSSFGPYRVRADETERKKGWPHFWRENIKKSNRWLIIAL